jgi:hypothetical protein
VLVHQVEHARYTLIMTVGEERVGGQVGQALLDRIGNDAARARDRLSATFEHQEKLTARRALSGQKGSVPVMLVSCALIESGSEDAAAVARLLPMRVRRVMSRGALVMW